MIRGINTQQQITNVWTLQDVLRERQEVARAFHAESGSYHERKETNLDSLADYDRRLIDALERFRGQ